jgi:hypothetical protein
VVKLQVWRLAPLLFTLRAEIDAAWPARSRASDGTIGDARHQASQSDHNPNESGVVRAWDITRDDVHGPHLELLAGWLRGFGLRGSDRMQRGAYIVWNGRICSHSSMWRWSPYRGSNPHTSHLHISAPVDAAYYEMTRPWKVPRDLRVR